MILDSLDNALQNVEFYNHINPLFGKAFEFLATAHTLEDGRYDIVGDDLYAMVVTARARAAGDADLEAHKDYIDIQMSLVSEESFAWSPMTQCSQVKSSYDASSDIMFFSDVAQNYIKIKKGELLFFFPSDGHAPLIGSGDLHKVIVKVKVK